jgi:hypothetical protein
MKKGDMDFLIKFAAASSAAFLLSGCTSEIESGSSAESSESAEKQDSAVTAPKEQQSSRESNNAQDPVALTPADKPVSRPTLAVVYGPPPNYKHAQKSNQSSEVVKQNLESELEVNAIDWQEKDPLVTINDENYRVGDTFRGYTIIEIRETEVVFRDPLGEKVIKSMYE